MAGIRDPAFWKRFSVAVHQDEEQQQQNDSKQPDGWLARQRAKRARRAYVCYGFWVGFAILIGLLVALILWMYQNVKDERQLPPGATGAAGGTGGAGAKGVESGPGVG